LASSNVRGDGDALYFFHYNPEHSAIMAVVSDGSMSTFGDVSMNKDYQIQKPDFAVF